MFFFSQGNKWRLCAAAAVFNSEGNVLVGERLGKKGAWQLPQGGVDLDESVVDAAAREAYEEVHHAAGKSLHLPLLSSFMG